MSSRTAPRRPTSGGDLARSAEALGYATFLVADHVHLSLAPIAALTAAAEATSTLRVGSYVFANDFRHPVLLAREAATIDVLSGGRLELGLGTGFWHADYEQLGLPLDPPGVRVARLGEALQILKGALAGEEPFSFSGAHYAVKDLVFRPQPVQRPRPPIAVGGGSRRLLALAAREADIVTVTARTTSGGGFDLTSRSADGLRRGDRVGPPGGGGAVLRARAQCAGEYGPHRRRVAAQRSPSGCWTNSGRARWPGRIRSRSSTRRRRWSGASTRWPRRSSGAGSASASRIR